MKKGLLIVVAMTTMSSAALGGTATFSCTPTAGTNSVSLLSTLFFTSGQGTGSFSCSDASLGAVTLSAVSVSIFSDYTAGNGTSSDPNDNSAGFTFSQTSTTWNSAKPGASTSTMALQTGLTLFTIGDLSSATNTFTNSTSGGLVGTSYVQPATDSINGTLLGSFSIGVSAFVDAGGFSQGASDARVEVTYTYGPVTTSAPEPASLVLFGSGMLAVCLFGRRKFAAQ